MINSPAGGSTTEIEGPTFRVHDPEGGPRAPLVFASPHSGRHYPPALMAATALDSREIRRSEDAFIDALVAGAPAAGIPLIAAEVARAYIDLNRDPWELDPAMFDEELPAFARGRTPRVAAGLGAIAKVVGNGREIYGRKLTFAEACGRVRHVHEPYHAALRALVDRARDRFGHAVLIDWHSMPSEGASGRDIVLGDRFGAACLPKVIRAVELAFTDLGYSVGRNTPYAGGYTTEAYGRPREGVSALQIEIDRSIYLDQGSLEPGAGFARLKRDVERVFDSLLAVAAG